MGGTIGFESVEHRGTRFWVELPFDPGSPPAVPATLSGATPVVPLADSEPGPNVIAFSDPFLRHRARVRSMQILIADDHAANRMVLQRLLRRRGIASLRSKAGTVLASLEVADYDGNRRPAHAGCQRPGPAQQLRLMEAGGQRRTPVLVLSADVTPESIHACERAGARAFLAKPVSTTRLLDSLADIALSNRVDSGRPPMPAAASLAWAMAR
jgi:two-component system sensor histidine kinase RpfC